MGNTKSGDVPSSNADINEGIVRSMAEKLAGPGTAIGRSMQVTPGGKDLQKRFAGDINLPGFFGSKDEQAGTAGSSYISEGVKPVTKSLRGKYLGQGASSLDVVDETEA